MFDQYYCDYAPLCGNGKLELGRNEACDDGNGVSGDGCTSSCELEEGWSCSGKWRALSVCSEITWCGNDNLNEGEKCDDGNFINGDGCTS
jgi:cysteine-rich repeat protein